MCHFLSHFFPAGRSVPLLLAVLAFALPAAAQGTFEVREISNPPGLITVRSTQVAAGASHRVRDFPVVAGTHRFGFWTFNGVRQSFPNGQAFVYPEAVVTEAIEAVAHYFPEAQDGDGDRLPDWWEYWMFGSRDRGPQDDHDGDGVRHEEEFQSGYSAAFRDGIPVGGVSARLSAPLRLIQRNRLTYSLRSTPLGLVAADGELAPGQSYTTPHLTGGIAGYTFVGFEVDGLPKRDVTGYYLNQITVTPTANTQIVARYVPAGADSDGDQIVDALEFQHFGGLQYNRADNPDLDGLSIGEEISQGLSLLTADTLVNGGISARLSAPLNYDRVRVPYLMESRPLGLLPRVNEMVNSGTARTSPHFGTDLVAGFAFGYWSVNGVRIAAPDGLARRQVQVTVNEPTTLVAHFFDPAADSDGDGLQDGWEWTTFGSLANAKTSDPDDDDLTIAQEQSQGLSAAHEDMAVSGGLSTRLSAPLNYETGTRKRLLVRSRPLGIAATTEQYLPVNASVTSTRYDFNDRYGEHYFTHWTRNGTRVSDATGHARAQMVLTLSEDTELVANFTQPGDDRDADGIPDYLELRMAENLAVVGPEADLDDDGFTYNQERDMGYGQLLKDQLRDGGVSVRLSAPATLQFEEPPMNLFPAQLVAVRGAAAGSLVAALAISPITPSRTYQFNLVLGDGDRDNSRFSLAGNELRLTAPLDVVAPRFLNARIRATDDLGIQRFYQVVVQVLEVPLITLQPADVFADKGGPATFRVLATGSAPLNYQWQFNEEDLPGETGSLLRLSGVTPGNIGSYRVVVSSPSGTATSNPALLTIVDSGAAPLLAWWPFDDAANPALALDVVAGLSGTSTGTYSAPGTGRAGKAGDRAMRFVPNQKVVANGSFANVAAARDRISIVFWQKLTSVRNSSAFWFTSPSSNSDFRGISGHVPWSDGNLYFDHAGCCTPGVQRVSGPLPAMDTSQWHHFAFVKQGGVKKVFVDGVLAIAGDATAPLPTDLTELIIGGSSVGNNMDGCMDDFAIYDAALSAEHIQLLASGMPPDRIGLPAAPYITLQPVDASAVRGASVTFQVAALGTAPLRYQWQFNEVDIPGETSEVLELSSVTPADIGSYRAVVTNAHGNRESNPATLGIFDPLGPSLLAFWRGEGNALDSVGVRHGTPTNGAAFAPGLVGQAFSFDGVNDRITPTSDLITGVMDNFTMEFWVNPNSTRPTTVEANSGVSGTSAQRYAIFPGHGGTVGAGVGVSVGTNGISVFEHGSNFMPSPLVHHAAISGWTHVAVAYQAKQPRLYVNGSLVRTGLTSTRQSVSPSAGVGGHAYGYFGGLIDEVSIYDRTLTANEIGYIYSLGSAGKGGLDNRIQLWAAGYGLSGDDALANANPSGDGINNLLKYAFNLNPIQNDVRVLTAGTGNAGLPLITWGAGDTVRFEFLRRKGAGLTYTPQISGSMEAGTWQPTTALPTVTSVDAEWERVIVVEALPPEMKMRVFARLLVSQPVGQ